MVLSGMEVPYFFHTHYVMEGSFHFVQVTALYFPVLVATDQFLSTISGFLGRLKRLIKQKMTMSIKIIIH